MKTLYRILSFASLVAGIAALGYSIYVYLPNRDSRMYPVYQGNLNSTNTVYRAKVADLKLEEDVFTNTKNYDKLGIALITTLDNHIFISPLEAWQQPQIGKEYVFKTKTSLTRLQEVESAVKTAAVDLFELPSAPALLYYEGPKNRDTEVNMLLGTFLSAIAFTSSIMFYLYATERREIALK